MGVLDELDKQERSGKDSVLGTIDRVQVAAHTRSKRRGLGASIVGGTAGALSSELGPLSVPIAGAGGAVGEAFQQAQEAGMPLVSPLTNPAAAIMSMGALDLPEVGRQANKQAQLQGVGGLIGEGAIRAASPLMQLALKNGPEVAQTAIREGIKVGKAGLNKLETKLGQYGAVTNRIATQASLKSGRAFVVPDMVKDAAAEIWPKVATSMTGEEREALRVTIQKFMQENPIAKVTALKLHKLKQTADTAARAIYNLPIGVKATPAQEAVAGFYKAFADRARATLNTAVQGYEESNAPTEALIKLKDALAPLTKKEMTAAARALHAVMHPLGRGAVGAAVGAALPGDKAQNALAGAGTAALLGSPTSLSTGALALTNPLLQLILGRIPAAANTAMTSQQ